MRFQNPGQWPKILPELTEEQERIRDDFHGVWLTELPKRYSIVEDFNHRYPLRSLKDVGTPIRTLDIGAGRGEHLEYEDLSSQEYVALELRDSLAKRIREKFPLAKTIVGDIQQRLDVPDGYFNRILAIHVLEHLPNLPKALDEVQRMLAPNGRFSVLIPCDPGLAYEIARNISAKRIFVQKYKTNYDWYIDSEHINMPSEIIDQLQQRFEITNQTYFPLALPVVPLNLIIGLTLRHRHNQE
ncbi:MAG: class I SAM-dependent methyltransferase [Anaerolineae bacterium]|nr:class I SAM-dependent methyltransferase [Anaerolineae bacterium]